MHYFILFTDFSHLKIKQIYKDQKLEDLLFYNMFQNNSTSLTQNKC